ncbi:MAG: outer membrane beta-barrel protein, partial [Alistipes sp.]|nr:outer membrane beta-barrel protein [Alistipes sp.]
MRALKMVAMSLLFMVAATAGAVAQRLTVSGRVVNDEGTPVPYATVVLTKDNAQVAGGATASNGAFTLNAAAGNYTLIVSFIGYKTETQELELSESINLGDITLETDSEQIEEVVITSQLIRREADRFVVDVANSPIALGKDGEELLKSSPGVWIQDDKISINGSSGSKIYLNDREVKLDDTQLIAYIRSLRAEDIQRIEVIPQSGADYDANSSGGIIKITTKRNLDMGLMGSASIVGNVSKNLYNVMPSLSLNYNSGGLNLYGRTWAGTNGYEYTTEEHTDYDSGTVIDAATTMNERSNWAGINLGFVYDINSRHSIGAELQHNYWGGSDITDTWTEHSLSCRRSEGDYSSKMNSNMTTSTLNYIIKLDEIGSNIKFIGDYTNSMTPHNYNYFDTSYDMTQMNKIDSTYRNAAGGRYQLATARVDYTKIFSDKLSLKAGVKYTFNKNGNTSKYEWLTDGNWIVNEDQSYDIGYTENIAAAYVTASARVGRWSLVGGLRGEYTHFHERGTEEPLSSYFKLFPNANISYSITPKGEYSLV